MAKYSIEIDVTTDTVSRTLIFNQREYKEVWTDNNFCCGEHTIVEAIKHDFPNAPDYLLLAIDSLSSDDVFDIMDAMHEVQEHESTLLTKE